MHDDDCVSGAPAVAYPPACQSGLPQVPGAAEAAPDHPRALRQGRRGCEHLWGPPAPRSWLNLGGRRRPPSGFHCRPPAARPHPKDLPARPVPGLQGGGGNPFGNMGNLMENLKKAQAMVQVEAAKVQEELAV